MSNINRRTLLSATAALPWLAQFQTRAHAAQPPSALPRRFILIRDTNGFGRKSSSAGGPALHRLVPPRAASATAIRGAGGASELKFQSADDLPPSLFPLRRWWKNTMVLDRFFNPFNVDLHGNGEGTYKVVPTVQLGTAPSIDALIADRLGAGLPFKVVSMSQKGDTAARYFDRYLGSLGSKGASQVHQRRGVLGMVRAQVARVRTGVSREDGRRLDQYLAALRENERSLEQLAGRQCEPLPVRSTLTDLGGHEPVRPLIAHAHLDIAATALTCGLTRVVSLNFVPGRGPFQFFDPNPNEFNLNGTLADQEISADTRYSDLRTGLRIEGGGGATNSWTLDRHDNHHAGHTAMLTAIDRWEAALIARLIDRLQAVPEGNGTMWDHTLILWANNGGGVHHYGHKEHPAVLIGGSGLCSPLPGAALRTGRSVHFPKETRAMSDLFVTVANAVGLPITTFGDPSVCQGPLPGLG